MCYAFHLFIVYIRKKLSHKSVICIIEIQKTNIKNKALIQLITKLKFYKNSKFLKCESI